MSSKQVIIFPRGQLHAKDKEKLTKLGIVALEADDPSRVVTIIPGVPMVSADDMLYAALRAISESNFSGPREHFTQIIYHTMKAKREAVLPKLPAEKP